MVQQSLCKYGTTIVYWEYQGRILGNKSGEVVREIPSTNVARVRILASTPNMY